MHERVVNEKDRCGEHSFCLVLINVMTCACFHLHMLAHMLCFFIILCSRGTPTICQVWLSTPKLAACHMRRRESSGDLIGKWIKIESW